MELKSLPEGWELKSLGEVAEYINGYHFGPNDWKGSGIPIIRIQNLNDPEASFNYFQGEIGKKYFVENGDLLISWSASLGAYFWNRGKALLNQHIFKVVENAALTTKDYLFYFISSILEDIKRKTHGSTMKHITKKDFEKIKIPLPPLEEQKKIVEILQFADYLKERRKEAIKIIDKIVMSVFYGMFGDPATNPKGWEVKKIGDIVKKTQYGISKPMNTEKKGFPILRMDNITYDGHLDLTNLKYIEIDRKIAEKYLLNKGDILFNRTNSKELVGKTTTFNIDGEYVFASYLIRLIPNRSQVSPEFVSIFLKFQSR